MTPILNWSYGHENYRECSLVSIDNKKYFTTVLKDNDFEVDRPLPVIFNDHISNRQTKFVEVLYSGGIDSELVLRVLISLKIPIKIVTMILKYDDLIINTHDLYYSEKFCRENDLQHSLVELNIKTFFDNGLHLTYLSPYSITEPHVSTHFWLIEQCEYFPIFGGDWNWVQMQHENKVLSPTRLDYSCYELFMKSRGITGIGNMLGHSLESLFHFIKLQIKHHTTENVSLLKKRMYAEYSTNIEARTRSYGWEHLPKNICNMVNYKLDLLRNFQVTHPTIEWNEKIKTLLGTTLTSNSKF